MPIIIKKYAGPNELVLSVDTEGLDELHVEALRIKTQLAVDMAWQLLTCQMAAGLLFMHPNKSPKFVEGYCNRITDIERNIHALQQYVEHHSRITFGS
jgi:hypothetical protein